MRKPLRQGEMDGLCGIYALVNAIRHLAGRSLSKEDEDNLFKELVRGIYKRNNRRRKRKPKSPVEFIWDGTSARDISYMLKKTTEFLHSKNVQFYWKKPLQGSRRPNTVDQYWNRIREAFMAYGGHGSCIALVDYNWQSVNGNGEDGHWTCVTNVTGSTLILHDSSMDHGKKFVKLPKSRCTLGKPTSRRPYRLLAHNVSLLRVDKTE